jgi:hypothetical protein
MDHDPLSRNDLEPTGSGMWNKLVQTYYTMQSIPHGKLKKEVVFQTGFVRTFTVMNLAFLLYLNSITVEKIHFKVTS